MTIDDQVLALLRTGGEWTTAAVAAQVGPSAFKALNRHRLRGDVRRIKPGLWQAVVFYTPAEIRARFKPR